MDCFRCKSGEDKECSKSCGPRVQYKPNKDSITYVAVKIHGLSSDRFFLFRIYSVNELNQQEKDRNKWKYAEVFVKTSTKGTFIYKFYKCNSNVHKSQHFSRVWNLANVSPPCPPHLLGQKVQKNTLNTFVLGMTNHFSLYQQPFHQSAVKTSTHPGLLAFKQLYK